MLGGGGRAEESVRARSDHLRGAARAAWDSVLGSMLESAALALEDRVAAPGACPRCHSIWIPAVTCRLRVVAQRGHAKSKKARRRAKERAEKYLDSVRKLKPDFEPRQHQHKRFVQYRCDRCKYNWDNPIRAVPTRKVQLGSANGISKGVAARERTRKRKQIPAASTNAALQSLKKPGLALDDFLL